MNTRRLAIPRRLLRYGSRTCALALALLLAHGLFAACSGDSGSDDPSTDTSDATPIEETGDDDDARDDATEDTPDEDTPDEDTPDEDTPDDTTLPEPTGPPTFEECFGFMMDPERPGPDYEQFNPVLGRHCYGTNHQAIDGIEKVVFLGDSVTVGTPPTRRTEYYRALLVDMLEERFGSLEVDHEFAKFGARVDDLLLPPHQQILNAFPAEEPLRTLVVMTIGGNDIFRWAERAAEGWTEEEIMEKVEYTIGLMRDAIHWFRDNDDLFPAGVFVIFANVFEYTDATGDTASCELATAIGLGEPWPEGRAPVVRFNEAFMEIAVETQTDMVFLLENFCGHGFRHDDPTGQCYRGEDAEQWFDFTCIHPNPTGHRMIAEMVLAIVDEAPFDPAANPE